MNEFAEKVPNVIIPERGQFMLSWAFPYGILGDMFSWLLMPMVFSTFRYLYEMEMENILVHKQAGAPTTYISARRRIVSTPIHFGTADMNKRMKRGALASGRR